MKNIQTPSKYFKRVFIPICHEHESLPVSERTDQREKRNVISIVDEKKAQRIERASIA